MVDFDADLHIFRSPAYRSVVEEAIAFFGGTPVHKLPPPSDPRFIGPGVYALYYVGGYDLYARVAEPNRRACVMPIYVGKAVPPGWRTARATSAETKTLFQRLNEHTRSLRQGANLDSDDFRCRFVILNDVESDLVGPVEAGLIRKYRPLWNSTVDGFGNHDPGSGRYNQARSEWDVLHPGREWANRLTGASPNVEDVIAHVKQVLANLPFS
ncbi:MAG: Eco29kI family restriction endonuclease [Chloroflexi bacterium]|nr:Eco29kI family restriction endonuclease [Chloroflexota bacterium]